MCTVVATHSLDSSGGHGIKTIRGSAEVHQGFKFPEEYPVKILGAVCPTPFSLRVGVTVAYEAHTLEVVGSIPTSAYFYWRFNGKDFEYIVVYFLISTAYIL